MSIEKVSTYYTMWTLNILFALKLSGSVSGVFVHQQPLNAFSKLERGEITLSQVQ